MTALTKIAANRRNAVLSTGPTTPTGKSVVARNATKHGIFSAITVVAGECPEAWEVHRAGVVEALSPVGTLETALAERVSLTLWRLHRLARFEAETTAAAVEDAALPADPVVDVRMAVFQGRGEEEVLKVARYRLRQARKDLATQTATADWLRRLHVSPENEPVPVGVMQELLSRAFGIVRLRPWHDDPAHISEPQFLTWLGLSETDAGRVRWTSGLLLRAIECYAKSIGNIANEFIDELEEFLDGEVERLDREVRTTESEITALTRRAETERGRRAAAALLPTTEQVDKIIRYEKHLHALLTSLLHELERLQARREGAVVAPPVVADVRVTVNHELG
jgi:hypothetical protein